MYMTAGNLSSQHVRLHICNCIGICLPEKLVMTPTALFIPFGIVNEKGIPQNVLLKFQKVYLQF